MEARYYRFIYRAQGAGVSCSGSMADNETGENFHFLYLGGGENLAPDETLKMPRGHFHLVIAADFRAQTVRQTVQLLLASRVDQVIYPAMDSGRLEHLVCEYEQRGILTPQELGFVKDPQKFLKGLGIEKWKEINDREDFQKGNRRFSIFGVGEGRERTLLLYHGSEGTGPQQEECVMNVKPVTPSRNCSPFVDPQNLNCEMRCMLYNDFTQCKRHNQREGKYFVDGHLVLGACRSAAYAAEIRKNLEAEWKKIRFVCLADDTSWEHWMAELGETGTAEMAQYFMGTAYAENTVLCNLLKEDPYRTFITLKEDSGLCVSGYYTGR